jgi:phosphate transport system substrate-binding protein
MNYLKTVFAAAASVLISAQAYAVDLTYAGSVTILEGVMGDAAPSFEKKTGLKVGLSGGGSGAGVKAVAAGIVQLGGVSRDLKDEEIKQGIVAYPIGYGAVALVANKAVTVESVTAKQAKDILTGAVTNWKQVNGPDLPIKVVVSTPGCACREEFQEMVMDKQPYVAGAAVSPMKTLSETVGNARGGVGPLATAVIDPAKVKVIKIDGVPPTPQSVKAKKYKASRQINIVTKGPAAGNARKFIDFMLSPEGQALVEKNFVGLK